jgi:hypothetical protein
VRLPLVALVLVVAGCASTHDLSRGPSAWGGGVYRETLQPGLHWIVVRSNVAPWTNQHTVGVQWQAEAARLCGGGHRALRLEDRIAQEHAPLSLVVVSLPYLITVRKGYALCDSSGLSVEQAERIIDARP